MTAILLATHIYVWVAIWIRMVENAEKMVKDYRSLFRDVRL